MIVLDHRGKIQRSKEVETVDNEFLEGSIKE